MINAYQIAVAVQDELNNASTISQKITATASLLPLFDPEDLQALRVDVVPATETSEIATRASSQDETIIFVAFNKSASIDECPTLIALVKEVAAYMRMRPLASLPGALWVRSTIEPICSYENLGELKVFTSLLKLTYKVLQ